MSRADGKQAVIYGIAGAAVAALVHFAPPSVRFVCWTIYYLASMPFRLAFVGLYGFSGGTSNDQPTIFIELLTLISFLAFWFWLLPRLLLWMGIWNPIHNLDGARPWSWRLLTAIGDRFNKLKFGKQKTGGWA